MIYPSIKKYIEETIVSFDSIPDHRKEALAKLSGFISSKLKEGKQAEVIYIWTTWVYVPSRPHR